MPAPAALATGRAAFPDRRAAGRGRALRARRTTPFLPAGALLAGVLGACEAPPDRAVVKAEPVAPAATRPDVALSDAQVTLDWRRSQMEIRATAVRPPGPRPDTLWLWAYLTNPGISVRGSWSAAPLVVVRPFAAGDTARIVAVGQFDWTALGASPGRGYYARVFASATSGAAAQIPREERLEDSTGATRVTSP